MPNPNFMDFLSYLNDRNNKQNEFYQIAKTLKITFDNFIKVGFDEECAYDLTKSMFMSLLSAALLRNGDDRDGE